MIAGQLVVAMATGGVPLSVTIAALQGALKMAAGLAAERPLAPDQRPEIRASRAVRILVEPYHARRRARR